MTSFAVPGNPASTEVASTEVASTEVASTDASTEVAADGAAEIAAFLDPLPASPASALRAAAGLARTRALLAMLGNPQDRFRAVHVAGSAGKGSVAALAASVLDAHGFSVGAYASPHVRSVLERFSVDGRPPATAHLRRELDDLAVAVRAIAAGPHGQPTYFEAATALAFLLFARRPVDYAVVETGLGGLLDATNTMSRADKLAVLSAIGRDHTQVLGDSLAEIAAQKAGILPLGGTAVAIAPETDEVGRVFAAEATRRSCSLDLLDPVASVAALRPGTGGRWRFSYSGTAGSGRLADLEPGLAGRHQVGNTALALRAVEHLARRDGWTLRPDAVRHGLRRTSLPGRFDRRSWRGHELVLDGAHSPMKLRALAATLRDAFGDRRFAWVLAMKEDKDVAAALEVLAPLARAVVATEFTTTEFTTTEFTTTEFTTTGGDHPGQRSVPASRLASAARRAGCRSVRTATGVAGALEQAVALAPAGLPVLVTGSFRLVATATAVIES